MTSPPMTSDLKLSRPIPKRLLSLQDSAGPFTPIKSTPKEYTYPSPISPPSPTTIVQPIPLSSLPTYSLQPHSPTVGMSRPGGPKRSHSFCGDMSACTYALASTMGNNLSKDKKTLVAPALERTLSSIGVQGNVHARQKNNCNDYHQSYGMTMKSHGPSRTLPTPPRSPPRTSAIPQITISSASPSRPGLNPIQTSPSRRHGQRPLRQWSEGSSPSNSYMIMTPSTTSSVIPTYTRPEPNGNEEKPLFGIQQEDDDLMVVDDMVEGVEDLKV